MFVQQTVARWARVTTWHGVADVYNSPSSGQRLFWLCLVLSATGLASWQISVTVRQYLNGNGYTTSVYFLRSPSINIPPITICNSNRARQSVLDDLNMTTTQLSAFYSLILGNYVVPNMNTVADWNTFASAQPGYASDLRALLAKVAHRCEEMLMVVKLSYNTPNVMSMDICRNSSFITTVQTLYGQCYSFTAPMAQTIAGPVGGLKMLLNSQTYEYTSNLLNNYADAGILAMMSADIYSPYPTNPLLLSPGTHAHVSLYSTRYAVVKPEPFAVFPLPCNNGKLKYLKASYDIETCQIDCMIGYMINTCGCVTLGMEVSNTSIPVCYPSKLQCIAQKVFTALSNASGSAVKCSMACGPSCQPRSLYTISMTSSQYPSEAVQPSWNNLLESFLNTSVNSADFILLDIFFSDIGQLNIDTVETTPFFSFIGTLGGQLGLWLGSSVITICQLFYYLLIILCGPSRKKPQDQLIPPQHTLTQSPYSKTHDEIDVNHLPIYY